MAGPLNSEQKAAVRIFELQMALQYNESQMAIIDDEAVKEVEAAKAPIVKEKLAVCAHSGNLLLNQD